MELDFCTVVVVDLGNGKCRHRIAPEHLDPTAEAMDHPSGTPAAMNRHDRCQGHRVGSSDSRLTLPSPHCYTHITMVVSVAVQGDRLLDRRISQFPEQTSMRSGSIQMGFVVLVLMPLTTAMAQPSDCNGNGVPDDIDLAGRIYWTDWGNGATPRIQRAELNGENVETLVTTGLMLPSGIALDVAAGKMYWADNADASIKRGNLDGSEIEDLITSGLVDPVGLELDIASGKMYWSETNAMRIQRADLDGSNVENLVSGLTFPFGIALDLSAGKIYWADLGTDKIQRSNLDGTQVENVITTGLMSPFGVAADSASGKVYLTDFDTDRIQRADLNGANIENLISVGLTAPLGIALNTQAGKMYWADVTTQKIHRADLVGNSIEDVVATGLIQPQFIAIAFPMPDSDGDGVMDACDTCPDDAAKTAPGECGCGLSDADADGNGIGDACEPAPGICGGGGLPLALPFALLCWRRRRRGIR